MKKIIFLIGFISQCYAAPFELISHSSNKIICNEIYKELKDKSYNGWFSHNIFTDINKKGYSIKLEDNKSLNVKSELLKNTVTYYVDDLNGDKKSELVLRTDVRIGSGGDTHREYYVLGDLKDYSKETIENKLRSLSWIDGKGLKIPSVIKFPIKFSHKDGYDKNIEFEEGYPKLILFKNKYYIFVSHGFFISILDIKYLENIFSTESYCLYEKKYEIPSF